MWPIMALGSFIACGDIMCSRSRRQHQNTRLREENVAQRGGDEIKLKMLTYFAVR
jgi:hypothetical protein